MGWVFLVQLETDEESQSCIRHTAFLAILNFEGFQELKNYYTCQQHVIFINCVSSGK